MTSASSRDLQEWNLMQELLQFEPENEASGVGPSMTSADTVADNGDVHQALERSVFPSEDTSSRLLDDSHRYRSASSFPLP